MRLCKWAGLGWARPGRGVWAAGATQAALETHPSWPWDGGPAPSLHRPPGPGTHTVRTPASRPALSLPHAVGLGFCFAKETGGGQLPGCL